MEAELVGVKRRLERLHDLAETTDWDILPRSPYFRRITSVSVHWPKIGNQANPAESIPSAMLRKVGFGGPATYRPSEFWPNQT